MKTLNLAATMMLLGTLTLGISATVDEQIAAIQAAAPEDRVELVNSFKTDIAQMSAEDRDAAITLLRSTMQTNAPAEQTQAQTQARTQTRTQVRAQVNQMQETTQMQQNQMMNQRQAGSQAMQQGMIGGGAAQNTPTQPHNSFMGGR